MIEDIVRAGARNVDETRVINRQMLEKSLHMRCLSYLSQVKAKLLTETIFEVDSSKKNVLKINKSLVEQTELVSKQKEQIEMQIVKLDKAKQELEKANRILQMKNNELERLNKLFVDREFRIKELRDRIKELEEK